MWSTSASDGTCGRFPLGPVAPQPATTSLELEMFGRFPSSMQIGKTLFVNLTGDSSSMMAMSSLGTPGR